MYPREGGLLRMRIIHEACCSFEKIRLKNCLTGDEQLLSASCGEPFGHKYSGSETVLFLILKTICLNTHNSARLPPSYLVVLRPHNVLPHHHHHHHYLTMYESSEHTEKAVNLTASGLGVEIAQLFHGAS